MFRTRRRKVEEEAKKDPDYRPTSELEADEEKPEYHFPMSALIVIGVLAVLMAACIILIVVLRK